MTVRGRDGRHPFLDAPTPVAIADLPIAEVEAADAGFKFSREGARASRSCSRGAAHRAGLHVHVWTVNDRATMHRLLDLGVDGIMTDRPRLLRDVFAERGLAL